MRRMGQSLHPRTESMSGRPVPIRRHVRMFAPHRLAALPAATHLHPKQAHSRLWGTRNAGHRCLRPPRNGQWVWLNATSAGGDGGFCLRCPTAVEAVLPRVFDRGAGDYFCAALSSTAPRSSGACGATLGSASAVAGSGLQFENQADQLGSVESIQIRHEPSWTDFVVILRIS